MTTKRKRKLEAEDETDSKWELANVLNEELREEMATMWEIPQIFHFLLMTKEALNITHLSMYEVERMLAMPRASKQLATIMTGLLGPSVPTSKAKKIPPMPYDFWVNVLTHKVQGWFKMYQSKHQDMMKVLDAIGIEPEFWTIFPDTSVIDNFDFERLSFKQRVWILKTLCDTVLHSRKTVQEEMVKQMNEDSYEFVLGSDRYGAKFIYFPMFLENDLRVYRHCMDNTILSTVKPPTWKETHPNGRQEKISRSKRKRLRWKNGSLPRDRKRRRNQEDELKMGCDSTVGSSINEDTNCSGLSSCSNNNNISIELSEGNRSRSPSKASELSIGISGEILQFGNPKSSGYDTNTSTSDAKSLNEAESEESFRGFETKVRNDENEDVLDGINDILDRLTSKVSAMVKREDSEDRTMDTDNSAVNGVDEDEKDGDEELSSSNVIDSKYSDSEDRPESRAESDDENWIKYTPRAMRNVDPETRQKELSVFSKLLADLSVSTFELAADSVETLRELSTILRTPEISDKRRVHSAPTCEIKLALAIDDLAKSLQDVEPKLKESTKKARTKLRKEWTNFRDSVEDQDTAGGSNGWIIGSQGCPEFPLSETELQALPESAVSPAGSKNSDESQDERMQDDTTESTEDGKGERKISERGKKSTRNDQESDNEDRPRRVLRARGISSYNEQLWSDEDEAYQLEKWSCSTAVYPAPGTSDGTSSFDSYTKNRQTGNEGETNAERDWILPGARKRKNRCAYTGGKLTPSESKSSSKTKKSNERTSSVSPPVPEDPLGNAHTPSSTKNFGGGLMICKVESVHSEVDIKDELPFFANSGASQNSQQKATVKASVKSTNNPRPSRLTRPPPSEIPPQTLPPAYYVQGPQTFYDPRYVRYPYSTNVRGDLPYGFQPLGYPGQPQFPGPWQPTGFPSMPGQYPSRPTAPTAKRGRGGRQQTASTTLYGARMPSRVPQNPILDPRSLAIQSAALRFPTRPRAPINRMPVVSSRSAPRQISLPKRAPAPVPRPARPTPRPQGVKKPDVKTTSVILLSDSDDEIEMIVPEKKTTEVAKSVQERKTVNNKSSPATPASKPKSLPVVTSEITMTKTNNVLSPQMIQRMSQGGISITPVKPATPKPSSEDNPQGTKLVVVVNETGSHYALALPNGSKLILTPEQVAQIRASNGGKLVL